MGCPSLSAATTTCMRSVLQARQKSSSESPARYRRTAIRQFHHKRANGGGGESGGAEDGGTEGRRKRRRYLRRHYLSDITETISASASMVANSLPSSVV